MFITTLLEGFVQSPNGPWCPECAVAAARASREIKWIICFPLEASCASRDDRSHNREKSGGRRAGLLANGAGKFGNGGCRFVRVLSDGFATATNLRHEQASSTRFGTPPAKDNHYHRASESVGDPVQRVAV